MILLFTVMYSKNFQKSNTNLMQLFSFDYQKKLSFLQINENKNEKNIWAIKNGTIQKEFRIAIR